MIVATPTRNPELKIIDALRLLYSSVWQKTPLGLLIVMNIIKKTVNIIKVLIKWHTYGVVSFYHHASVIWTPHIDTPVV